jgi:hypothetical protein
MKSGRCQHGKKENVLTSWEVVGFLSPMDLAPVILDWDKSPNEANHI